MYRILLSTLLLVIFSCESSTEPTDCADVANGTAAIDDCGVCAGGTTGNVANADKDCAGVCSGSAVVDACDECGGDGSSCMPSCADDCSAEIMNLSHDTYGAVYYCNSVLNETCFDDCEGDMKNGFDMVSAMCTACLSYDTCEEVFSDEYDEGSDDDDGGPPDCILDCEGIGQIDPEAEDQTGFCEFVVGGGLSANNCNSDCDADILEELTEYTTHCTACLESDTCDE